MKNVKEILLALFTFSWTISSFIFAPLYGGSYEKLKRHFETYGNPNRKKNKKLEAKNSHKKTHRKKTSPKK